MECNLASSTSRSRTSPRSDPSHCSPSTSGWAHRSSTRGPKVRRSLRRRRAATRCWCSPSTSPIRVSGSFLINLRTPVASAATTVDAAGSSGPMGSGFGTSGGAVARGPRARTALGIGSAGTAPAVDRASATSFRPSSAKPLLSISISRKRATTRRCSRIETSSSATSATAFPSSSNTNQVLRRVRRRATGPMGALRANAVTRSRASSGTTVGEPEIRISSLLFGVLLSAGSFRVQPSSSASPLR